MIGWAASPSRWPTVVEADDALARRAGELGEVRRLRGHAVIHLAAADQIHDPHVVVTRDWTRIDAATAEGMTIAELS